jgi:hypothetical protein
MTARGIYAAPTASTTSDPHSLPKQAEAKIAKNQNQSPEIILDFPADRAMGTLYSVGIFANGQAKDVSYTQKFFARARGPIHVPKDTKLRLDLSYQGGEDASLLPPDKESTIVAVNCRRIGSVNDTTVSYLARLPGLMQLFLDETDITDKAMVSIGRMKNLTELSFPETGITGKGMLNIEGLSKVNILNASTNVLGNVALPSLLPFKDLFRLNLDRTNISDGGLKILSKVDSLVYLNICKNPHITNAGIAYLVALKKLESLDVSETDITIDALPSLKKMKSLKYIKLNLCRISRDDVLMMKKALPQCHIETSPKLRLDPAIFGPLH